VAKKRPPDRRLWIGGSALLALVVVGVAVAAVSMGGKSAKPLFVDFGQLPGLQTGPPPWNNGVGALTDHLSAVHLDPLSQEALAFTSTSTWTCT
jgi:hypothetical protein